MKKRIFSLVVALVLAVACFSLTACGEVKQGSKIQRMKMVLEFRNEKGEVTDEKTVGIELYLNFAPETTKQFMKLAEEGYYDGVCISNVYDKYLEFGEYTGKKAGELTENKKTASPIKGEFEDNGIVGNKLSSSSTGVLIMKHDADDKDGTTHYDSAKGTVIVTLNSASAAYPSKSYCVFGRITSDDADKNPKKSYSDSTSVNRTGKSSLEIIKTVADLASKKEDGEITKTYYDSKVKKFYTYIEATDEDTSETTKTWYEGLGDSKTEISDKTVIEELGKKIDDEKYTFYTVPYAFVTIKSITKAK